jgi:hypothetical protein
MIQRFTKAHKRARIREILDGQSDDEIAALLKEMQDLSLAGLQIFKQRAGMTPGEIIVDRLRYQPHAHEVLRLPLRGRPLRDWLPPSYDEHVWRLRRGGHVDQLHARLSEVGGPLGPKVLIGKRWYEECKAEEEWHADDDTRVATLLLEAQLDMLERPFASIASLGSKSPTRSERIETLVRFFEMMLNGKRLSKDTEAELRAYRRSDGECRSKDDANEALPIILLASWALSWVRDELVERLEARPRESAGVNWGLGDISPCAAN